ncbi:M20/M25/M40 family metallo-hydrolase [Pseudonocardia humida]|uniref:M20/M25/M40 family metallo-hydrolase n=1 Tax=Pseudonocardia humida TaxID=2800819 RepID=A0ABT1ACH3_9PSEU|nr:M20/M25/M40 family metallo-hydrolase [Pseudonocardia humida]MCO1660618.1 M20/M25/M40 family metallo-hydrolase [Pseudonocardia humida]
MDTADDELRERVFARLDGWDLAGAVARLVATPSQNPPGGEDAMAAAVADMAGLWGLAARVEPVADGRSNVRVTAGDRPAVDGPEPCDVLLVGHLDTVPADPTGWTVEPFAGRVVDGNVWGRGSVDMKGGLASMLAALAALHEVAPDRAARVQLYGVAGEEVDCVGSRTVAASGRLPAAGCLVVGEPTGLRVVAAHKGALRLEVVVHGRAAHGARPELGANAVTAMAAVVTACAAVEPPALAPHPLLGPATVSVNQISGGTAANVVPDRCRATLDIRTLPGHDHDEIRRLVERAVARGLAGLDGVTGAVAVLNEAAPVATDLDDPLVAAALAAASVADGGGTGEPTAGGAAFFSDASVLQPALAGVPTILFGPGATERMHQVDEHVAVADLHTAARCYAALMIDRVQRPPGGP